MEFNRGVANPDAQESRLTVRHTGRDRRPPGFTNPRQPQPLSIHRLVKTNKRTVRLRNQEAKQKSNLGCLGCLNKQANEQANPEKQIFRLRTAMCAKLTIKGLDIGAVQTLSYFNAMEWSIKIHP